MVRRRSGSRPARLPLQRRRGADRRHHNLKALATAPEARGRGVGSALITALEEDLAGSGQRVLLVETSSADAFNETQVFYANRGFREEARIAEFWAAGEDKIIFWKSVAPRG